jgi:uncharacterized Fe-S cluster protein YjdI
MADRIQEYRSDNLIVTFDPGRCIHAGECVRGLPEVFNVRERRWLRPENAPADAVAEVIQRCPSGALQYQRLDGGVPEAPDAPATITPVPNGPYFVRGAIELVDGEGNAVDIANRAALCRCGRSGNKPFCDNSHLSAGFEAE